MGGYAPGTDGQTVAEAKETFEDWIEPMLGSVHRYIDDFVAFPSPLSRPERSREPG